MNSAFLMMAASRLVCPSPTFTPASGAGATTVTVAAVLSGAYIFYKKSTTGSLPTHTGDTAGAGTTRIGTGSGNPSASVAVGSGNFMEALTYKAGYTDSPIREGFYGTEVIEP